MTTEKSYLTEYRVLAENILFDFTLRYKKAIEQDPTLPPYRFFDSTSEEFREQLMDVAAKLFHKAGMEGFDARLMLGFRLQKMNGEFLKAYVYALLSFERDDITAKGKG